MIPSLRFLAAFLSGSVAVGGFHPFEFWFLPLISLYLVIVILKDLKFRYQLAGFYIYGLGFLLPLLHWSSTYVGALPWILLAGGFASFFSLLAFGIRGNQVRVLTFSLVFMIAESARALMPFGGFGWGRYGFSQVDGPLSQWLRIGGVSLTGGVMALVAALFASRIRYMLWLTPIFAVGLFAPFTANAATQDAIRIGLVQGGVSQLGLEFNATPREVLDRHLKESKKLLERSKVDLVIWPENASDIDPLTDPAVRKAINSLIRNYRTPMVIGAVIQGKSGPENVSILFKADRTISSIYQKRDLVPFGEYVPMRTIAKRFSSLVDQVSDFSPGKKIVSHEVSRLQFAPLICYEILDDRVAWENISRSSLGVVQTNNATFGRSWQSGQQFQMTRVRAFESRIPFVVAATTGDTALIDSDGRVISKLPKYKRGHLVVYIAGAQPRTPPIAPEPLLGFSIFTFAFLTFRDLRDSRPARTSSKASNDLILS